MSSRESMPLKPVGSSVIDRAHLGMYSTVKQPSGHRGSSLGIPFHSPRDPLKKMASAVFSAKRGVSINLSSLSPPKTSTGSIIPPPMKPTGNSSTPGLTIKTSALIARLEKTSMTTGMTGSSSVKRSTDSVVDRPMEHPSGNRGNWLGIPTRSPRGPLKKMTSVVFTAKSDMFVDMPSTSPSESSTGSVIHYPIDFSGNSSSPDCSPKTIHLEKTRITTGMAGSSSVNRSTDVGVDQPMEHPSGHRGKLLGIPTRSTRGPLKKITSVVFSAKSGMSIDMSSTSLSESSVGTVIHHPVKPPSNSSSLYMSIMTSAPVARLEKTSMTTGMSGSSSVKRSTDSVADRPMEHRSLKVSSKLVERNGRKVPAVPFECCSCGEEDCLAPSPPLAAPHTPVKSTGLNFVRAAYRSCEGGQVDGTLPCASTTTSFEEPERLKRLRERFNGMSRCRCGDENCVLSYSPIPSPTQRDGYFGQKKLSRPSERHPCRLGYGAMPISPIPILPSQPDGIAGKLENSVALEDCQLEKGEIMLPSPTLTGSSMKNGDLEQDQESSSFQRCPCGQPNCVIPNSLNPPPITPPIYDYLKPKSMVFEDSQWDMVSVRLASPAKTLPSMPNLSEATGALPPTSREVQPQETSSRLAWENYIFSHKPLGYDYLESCPDFRALHDNEYAVGGWAIGEGSLVIGVNPRYVVPTDDVQPLDQLELKEGKLYMVERIHGDLWALVKEFSTKKPHNGRTPGPPNQVVRLGFVPICAVTLAANYSSFVERCREYEMYPDIRRLTPTNGARISPPMRIESLVASREVDRRMLAGRNIWESKDTDMVCSKFRPIRDSECLYEPKDKLSRMTLMVNKPRRALKKLTTKKLEVRTSWVGPDPVTPQAPKRQRNRLKKGTRRRIDVGESFRQFCTWIRGN